MSRSRSGGSPPRFDRPSSAPRSQLLPPSSSPSMYTVPKIAVFPRARLGRSPSPLARRRHAPADTGLARRVPSHSQAQALSFDHTQEKQQRKQQRRKAKQVEKQSRKKRKNALTSGIHSWTASARCAAASLDPVDGRRRRRNASKGPLRFGRFRLLRCCHLLPAVLRKCRQRARMPRVPGEV